MAADRRAAITGRRQRADVRAGRRATSSRVTSGLDLRRAEDAGVDEHDLAAVLADPVAQIVVLRPLVSSVPSEDDGRHLRSYPSGRQAGLESLSARRGQPGLLAAAVDLQMAPSRENDSFPSGDQAGSIVSMPRARLPAQARAVDDRSCRSRSASPPALLWKAIRLPSGDQAGSALT